MFWLMVRLLSPHPDTIAFAPTMPITHTKNRHKNANHHHQHLNPFIRCDEFCLMLFTPLPIVVVVARFESFTTFVHAYLDIKFQENVGKQCHCKRENNRDANNNITSGKEMNGKLCKLHDSKTVHKQIHPTEFSHSDQK